MIICAQHYIYQCITHTYIRTCIVCYSENYFIVIAAELTCPICCELYKKPRRLSCFHCFCEGCLEKLLVESRIMCPVCRAESSVPAGGVKNLPANIFVSTLLDEVTLKHKEANKVSNEM